MHPLADSLREAARLVARVAAGRSLPPVLDLESTDSGRLRPAVTDLCFGTLRRYGRMQETIRILSRRGRPTPRVEALLWCALYALESKRYGEHTVVDQAVRACNMLGDGHAAGYVNALLRERVRASARVEAQLAREPVARHQHPAWWIERLRADYPDDWERILSSGNGRAPMALRANARRSTAQAYVERLAMDGIRARVLAGGALLLEQPVAVQRLPGFRDGDVSVQDAGAQRTAGLLELRPGLQVLDACAAPGGKAAHILETASVELTALELEVSRAEALTSNLRRLGLAAQVRVADCCDLQGWWRGEMYDRVLADVPCTGSGIVRRHPDIKWLRREADLAAFAARQARILDALWRVLIPGGKLLYVTCSVFDEENEAVVTAFVERTASARRLAAPGQLLPGAEHDGFYFALLEKKH
ncbi:MAG TPA: 16S rRNA (cytosine(967)-C(5))-methyltransferase RsmB [Burkholderiales bacterium]|nr:16S rRNA (cytosine(967)-C(5))-methyltransferase RsmB [Burkholderiales bacterium]